MARNLGIIAAALAAAAGLFYYLTVSAVKIECEIVMEYRGRSATVRASGATREDARRTAVTSACGQISRGMTELIQCENTPPHAENCSQ